VEQQQQLTDGRMPSGYLPTRPRGRGLWEVYVKKKGK
jgi:hypothetical protein